MSNRIARFALLAAIVVAVVVSARHHEGSVPLRERGQTPLGADRPLAEPRSAG